MNQEKKKPLLTAIIFTYNHAGRIADCIESHLNQKTTYPYEIQIWDDCSNDGTTDICREYAKKYPEKIKLTVQEKNTFLYPYEKTQSYQAIQQISTKYFCIIDGDDCWCNENKIQIALDILENNPKYIGFAHDTMHVDFFTNKKESWIHKLHNWDVQTEASCGAKPFFFTSSRIFRNIGFKDKKVWPVDYLLYYYHFTQGPIYYYDKIMACYNISNYSTFNSLGDKQRNLCSAFAYKLALFFNFKQDDLCMDVQKYYDKIYSLTLHYRALSIFKKILGIKLGWKLWFFITFVPKYGFECLNINWVYPRKKIIHRATNRCETELNDNQKRRKTYFTKMKKQEDFVFILEAVLTYNPFIKTKIAPIIKESLKRKYKRISNLKRMIFKLDKDILKIKEKRLDEKRINLK